MTISLALASFWSHGDNISSIVAANIGHNACSFKILSVCQPDLGFECMTSNRPGLIFHRSQLSSHLAPNGAILLNIQSCSAPEILSECRRGSMDQDYLSGREGGRCQRANDFFMINENPKGLIVLRALSGRSGWMLKCFFPRWIVIFFVLFCLSGGGNADLHAYPCVDLTEFLHDSSIRLLLVLFLMAQWPEDVLHSSGRTARQNWAISWNWARIGHTEVVGNQVLRTILDERVF